MQRPLRALAYMLIVTVAYNVLVVIASHIRAPVLTAAIALAGHGRGFTMGWSAGCLATGERGLLAVAIIAVLLVSWPTDPVPVAIAVVVGGLLGVAIRSFVRAHHEPVPTERPR